MNRSCTEKLKIFFQKNHFCSNFCTKHCFQALSLNKQTKMDQICCKKSSKFSKKIIFVLIFTQNIVFRHFVKGTIQMLVRLK